MYQGGGTESGEMRWNMDQWRANASGRACKRKWVGARDAMRRDVKGLDARVVEIRVVDGKVAREHCVGLAHYAVPIMGRQ